MKVDITKIRSGYEDEVAFEFSPNLEEEIKDSEIIRLEDFNVEGKIINDHGVLVIEASLSGVMILPCAITLEEVPYPFSFEIEEDLEEEGNEKNTKRFENTIDIFPIIWENILMEIPMRVVSEKAKDIHLEGDGWRLITDEEENS